MNKTNDIILDENNLLKNSTCAECGAHNTLYLINAIKLNVPDYDEFADYQWKRTVCSVCKNLGAEFPVDPDRPSLTKKCLFNWHKMKKIGTLGRVSEFFECQKCGFRSGQHSQYAYGAGKYWLLGAPWNFKFSINPPTTQRTSNNSYSGVPNLSSIRKNAINKINKSRKI